MARELARRRRACRGRCRGTGSRARGRPGTRGSSPPSRASRSRRGRARRRPTRARAAASSSDIPSASTQRTRTRAVVDARVLERLVHREVGVVQLHVLADERDLDARRRARAMRSVSSRHSPSSACRSGSPSFVQTSVVEALAPGAPRARGRRRRRRRSRSRPPASTSAKRAIFSRMSAESGSRERQTMMSGWIPMRRSSLTECCVGFVFSSPAASMNGTSVTWT